MSLIIVSTPIVTLKRLDGMEGGIATAVAIVLAAALARSDRQNRSIGWMVASGVAAGLLVMARLDFLPAVIVIFPVLMWLGGWRRRQIIGTVAGFVVVVAPYFVWNEVRFGHLLSVSGTVKLSMMGQLATTHFGSRFSAGYVHYVITRAITFLYSSLSLANPLGGSSLAGAGFTGVFAILAIAAVLVYWTRMHRSHSTRRTTRSWWQDAGGVDRAGIAVSLILTLHAAIALVTLPLWATGWYLAPSYSGSASPLALSSHGRCITLSRSARSCGLCWSSSCPSPRWYLHLRQACGRRR